MTVHHLTTTEELSQLSTLHFRSEDVLNTAGARHRRMANLLRALVLESQSSQEVVLFFEDLNSCRKVKSRVMATSDDRILLEQGFSLPIRSILRVEFLS